MAWSIVNDGDGLPRIILTETDGSSAVINLFGGQVLSWKDRKGEEMLFVSAKVITNQPKPIRGGIRICFPKFGNLGAPETQGFAGIVSRLWELDSCPSPLPRPNCQSSVDLLLKSTPEDLKIWPHSFELRLRVILNGSKLTLIARVRNTSGKPFTFTYGIRNNLAVSDVSEVRVEGLETVDYFDNLENGERFTEQGDALTFDEEVDRVYVRTPTTIAVIDHEKKRTVVLRKESLPDAGVWNPWDKKAKALPDFGNGEYQRMLRIDSAVAEAALVLKPQEEWTGWQELSVVSSSYNSGQLDPWTLLIG